MGIEGAPLTLLEGVTTFLIHQRAALRRDADSSLSASTAAGARPSQHLQKMLHGCIILQQVKCCLPVVFDMPCSHHCMSAC